MFVAQLYTAAPHMRPWMLPVIACLQSLLKETLSYLWLPSLSHLSNIYHAFMFKLKTSSSFFLYGIDFRCYKCVVLVL